MVLYSVAKLSLKEIFEAQQVALELVAREYANRHAALFLENLAFALDRGSRKTDEFSVEIPSDESDLECLLQFAGDLRGHSLKGDPVIHAVWCELVVKCEAETKQRQMGKPK